MVAYRALYGDTKLWCRPYDMFLDEVNKNGQKYRFELQDIKSVKESDLSSLESEAKQYDEEIAIQNEQEDQDIVEN